MYTYLFPQLTIDLFVSVVFHRFILTLVHLRPVLLYFSIIMYIKRPLLYQQFKNFYYPSFGFITKIILSSLTLHSFSSYTLNVWSSF